MNYQEAHEYMENLQREMTKHRFAYSNELIIANGMAILALEKQIPKKPFVDIYGDLDYMCPTCHRIFKKIRKGKMFAYCADCGQAIDWSDE